VSVDGERVLVGSTVVNVLAWLAEQPDGTVESEDGRATRPIADALGVTTGAVSDALGLHADADRLRLRRNAKRTFAVRMLPGGYEFLERWREKATYPPPLLSAALEDDLRARLGELFSQLTEEIVACVVDTLTAREES
jgi:hypothetical protein